MEQNNNSRGSLSLSSGTIGFITFIVFLILKLTKVIDWNWFWVFFPLWFPIAINVLIFGIMLLFVWIKDR